jgi:molybdate/tungstate transport system substrate-binding protein
MRASNRTLAVVVAGVLALIVLTASAPAAPTPVAVANAGVLGSMVTALKTLVPNVTLTNTTGGSVALAQGIEAGTQAADVFGSADASVNQFLLGDSNKNKERWFAAFAVNAIVMQYSPNPSDPHHDDFVKAANGQEPWWQPLVNGPAISLCRMSPDADPSGYYTLMVFQLAQMQAGVPSTLGKTVLGDDRNPAQTSASCSQGKTLAAGTLDVNFTYLSAAAAAAPGTPYIALPDAINLSNPDDADTYAKASFTNSAGQTFHGGVIRPSFAPIEGSASPDGAHALLQYIFQNQASLVSQSHFLPSALYAGGDPTAIPADLRTFFERQLQVLVKLNRPKCKPDKLAVSGDGVTVSDTDPQQGGSMCLVSLDVAAGQTGVRDLMVVKGNGADDTDAADPADAGKTFTGVVNLLEAVPIVPDFLPDTTPAVAKNAPGITIKTDNDNGITPITPATLSEADLAALPQQTFTVTINGTQMTERGPTLSTLLTRAGVTFISSCKNDELRYWIQAAGASNTAAVVTAGENDTGFGNNPALLSLTENGTALSAPRFVVTKDTTADRDVQGVTQLTIGRAAPQLANTATPSCTAPPFTPPVTAPPAGSILINGAVQRPVTLTFAQLQAMPQVTQTDTFLAGPNPTTVTEAGPTLFDVLSAAEPQFQQCNASDDMRWYVEVTSSQDGYAATWSWAEIHPFLGGKQALISLSENGTSLQSAGPRVTAPGDVKGGRYVSGAAVITVFRAPDYGPGKGGCKGSS